MEATIATQRDLQLERLKRRFGGEVITPTDERYGAARCLFNLRADRRPALIVQPRTAQEVAAARDACA
jgi:hypothetical protein